MPAQRFLDRMITNRIIRTFVYALVGVVSFPGLTLLNRLKISGTEHLRILPRKNVLFVSNHHTYYIEVIAFLHIFCAVKWKKQNRLGIPFYLLNPFVDVFFIAAEDTMRRNWLSRFLSLAGALMVKRTWRAEGEKIRRGLDPADVRKITQAMDNNWVITFPQGTTKPFAPIRQGTARLVKLNKPIVVPIVIRGFRRAFEKKRFRLKRIGGQLSVVFKKPLNLTYTEPLHVISEMIMDAIEQSEKFTGLPPDSG